MTKTKPKMKAACYLSMCPFYAPDKLIKFKRKDLPLKKTTTKMVMSLSKALFDICHSVPLFLFNCSSDTDTGVMRRLDAASLSRLREDEQTELQKAQGVPA